MREAAWKRRATTSSGTGDRAKRGVHGSALERGAGRRLYQQFGGAGEGGRIDPIAEDPPQRLHAANLTSGDRQFGVVVRHTLGMWRATSPGAKL